MSRTKQGIGIAFLEAVAAFPLFLRILSICKSLPNSEIPTHLTLIGAKRQMTKFMSAKSKKNVSSKLYNIVLEVQSTKSE